MRTLKRNSALDVYQLLLAIFLFASPWLFAYAHSTVRLDSWFSAIFLAAMSLLAIGVFREWQEWINVIIGGWIASSPWILGFQHATALHINLAVGILIMYLALLKLWLTHYGPQVMAE